MHLAIILHTYIQIKTKYQCYKTWKYHCKKGNKTATCV